MENRNTIPKIRFAGFADAWEQRKLGEITNIKTGSSDLQDSDDDGEYPFFVRSENIERSNRYIFEGEAILIPGEGRLGDIYHYINGKFDYHQRVYKISDFEDLVTDGKFVLYYLQQNFKRHALKFTVKATVDSLRLPMLLDFEVKLPSLEEQKKISALFYNLDNLITLHQRMLLLFFIAVYISLDNDLITKSVSWFSSSCMICKYVFCVVVILECPNLLATLAIVTPSNSNKDACV